MQPEEIDSKNTEDTSAKYFFSFLKNYKSQIFVVAALSIFVNILGVVFPRLTSKSINLGIESLFNPKVQGELDKYIFILIFVSTVILLGTLINTVVSNFLAEKIAFGLRNDFIKKISNQSYRYIEDVSTAKILTNITSDIDAVKGFVTQGVIIIFSSIVLLIGSTISLLTINWQLAIPVLMLVPLLFVAFAIIFSKLSIYFVKAQEIIDSLNQTINETIIGASLIRVLNSKKFENEKFKKTNTESKEIGIKIVKGFAILVPLITVLANISTLIVLSFGGIQIIDGKLNPGDYTAFFTYVGIFITPIIMLGFLSTIFTRAFASYNRIYQIISDKNTETPGKISDKISGGIDIQDVSLVINKQNILKNVNFSIKPGSRNAIIGPTGSGKTQIFNLLTRLTSPTKGNVIVDGKNLQDYKQEDLYKQIGLVFQDSVLFNTTIRENIAFADNVLESDLNKAIETAELKGFIDTLENGLETKVSERGASLSGGQKQRLTLARALTLNPKILLLDDFTARVDIRTEKQIFENLAKNYPDTTIISITQKIEPIKEYDQIILIMEGELVAIGKHDELLEKSFEYQQIFNSQQSVEE